MNKKNLLQLFLAQVIMITVYSQVGWAMLISNLMMQFIVWSITVFFSTILVTIIILTEENE